MGQGVGWQDAGGRAAGDTRLSHPADPSLAFDRASGETSQDLALEDEDEHDERQRHQHRSGQDVAPGQLELRIATEAGDRWLHGAGA